MRVYYTINYNMGNCNLAKSATVSWGNVTDFSAERVITL